MARIGWAVRWRCLGQTVAVISALVVAGCASQVPVTLPPPRLLTAEFDTAPRQSLDEGAPRYESTDEPVSSVPRELTLAQAIEIALRRHPALAAAELEVQARSDEYRQAGRLPNPELQTDVENFGGSGAVSGFDNAETTVTLGQLIELGGKRARRQKIASSEMQLAAWDLETERIAVYRDVTRLYVSAVASEQKLAIAQQLVLLAERLRRTVDERVRAGNVSPLESQRAQIVVGRASSERDAVVAARAAAFRSLATALGMGGDQLSLSGRFQSVTAPPSATDLTGFLNDNPDVARWSAEIEASQARLEYERAKRVPDLTVGVGVRRFETTEDNALVATFSLPIPLFDRNQGGIGAASSRLAQSRANADNARLDAALTFEQAYSDLAAAAARALSAQSGLLPTARMTFESTQAGYQEGKFDLVTLLDAQRTYFEIELDTIDATASYYLARANMEALIGRDLSSIVSKGENDRRDR